MGHAAVVVTSIGVPPMARWNWSKQLLTLRNEETSWTASGRPGAREARALPTGVNH